MFNSRYFTRRCVQEERETVQIVTRETWGARPPSRVPKMLKKPAYHVFYSLTYCGTCNKFRRCKLRLKELQNKMMTVTKYEDIPYNFMLGGDGLVYEGRGWGVVPDLPKKWRRLAPKSIFIAFVAPEDEQRCLAMQDAKFDLVDYGMAHGHIDPDYMWYDVRKGNEDRSKDIPPGLFD